MGGRFPGFLLGNGGFFMGIGYIILYFFVFFRTGFGEGCVWDDGLIFRSGGVKIQWVFIVSPLS